MKDRFLDADRWRMADVLSDVRSVVQTMLDNACNCMHEGEKSCGLREPSSTHQLSADLFSLWEWCEILGMNSASETAVLETVSTGLEIHGQWFPFGIRLRFRVSNVERICCEIQIRPTSSLKDLIDRLPDAVNRPLVSQRLNRLVERCRIRRSALDVVSKADIDLSIDADRNGKDS